MNTNYDDSISVHYSAETISVKIVINLLLDTFSHKETENSEHKNY